MTKKVILLERIVGGWLEILGEGEGIPARGLGASERYLCKVLV